MFFILMNSRAFSTAYTEEVHRTIAQRVMAEAKKMGKEFITISLDDLRAINVDKITQQLMAVTGFNKVIVNAVDYVDVQVFAIDCYDSGYETREKLYVPHGYSVDEGHWKRTG